VFFDRGLASAFEKSLPPLLRPTTDPALQAQSSDLESNSFDAKHLFRGSAVIKGSVVMKNADLVSHKIQRCVLTKVDSPCRRKNVRMGLDSF
jgi:hypothetical protein